MSDKLLDLDAVRIDPALALRLPPALALRRQVLPIAARDGKVFVACADPLDTQALEAVERFTGCQAIPQAAERESLARALARVYADITRPARPGGPARAEATILDPDDPVGLSAEILHAALLRQASDVHLDAGKDELRVRLRVDGVLEEFVRLPLSAHAGLLSRLKVMAGMDIAERRAPQDGGFTHRYGPAGAQRGVDIRAATLPTRHGERMTLRLLALQMDSLGLERLGMGAADLARMESFLAQPHGLALLTGPTGSGKTTTLYAALNRILRGEDLNVITIEDPIECDLPGVSQVEVDSADKVSFGKALRSALRHDPDVMMIGEIRDGETLDIAVKAALTGHLVLSTLHTNSAASAVTRLADMGMARYLIAATLRMSVAQRLVRKLCPRCRAARALAVPEALALGHPEAAGKSVYDPSGCVYCAGRGYAGRMGLFEILWVDDEVAGRIAAGANEGDLSELMRARKDRLLREDAAEKVFEGLTSVAEALQAVTAV